MENKFDYKAFPDKLNLGCGFDKIAGYLNIDLNDFHQPDLVADVSDLNILLSGFYCEIIALDILEYIERTKTKKVLSEWNRLSIPGGIVKLRVPNVIGLFSLFVKTEFQTPEKQEELIQCCFGTQVYNGDFHYTSFTEVLMRNYLTITGFEIISISVRDEWLFEIVAKKTGFSDLFTKKDDKEISAFLMDVYLKILHRLPDDGGYNYYYNQLIEGKFKKEDVIHALANSEEKKRILESSSEINREK